MASADIPQPRISNTEDAPHPPLLCQDPLTSTAVFLAPARGARPIEFAEGGNPDGPSAEQATCPFCHGHESLAPPSVLALPTGEAWQARVVPNRYPIVSEPRDAATAGVFPPRPALGVHEVLIESPQHDTHVEKIASTTWAVAWQAAHQRLAALATTPHLRWAMLFKNAGPQAGASLAHVHSQIVGLDFVPPAIQHKNARLRRDPSLHEKVLADAASEGRLWAEDEGLVAFVPTAARQPFETCIMPGTAEPHFHLAPAASVAAIARLTHRYAHRLSQLTNGGNYNWWLHQPAFDLGTQPAGWRWHLEIMPRLTQLAGFELGSGCHITTVSPAHSAHLLRSEPAAER